MPYQTLQTWQQLFLSNALGCYSQSTHLFCLINASLNTMNCAYCPINQSQSDINIALKHHFATCFNSNHILQTSSVSGVFWIFCQSLLNFLQRVAKQSTLSSATILYCSPVRPFSTSALTQLRMCSSSYCVLRYLATTSFMCPQTVSLLSVIRQLDNNLISAVESVSNRVLPSSCVNAPCSLSHVDSAFIIGEQMPPDVSTYRTIVFANNGRCEWSIHWTFKYRWQLQQIAKHQYVLQPNQPFSMSSV